MAGATASRGLKQLLSLLEVEPTRHASSGVVRRIMPDVEGCLVAVTP